MDGQFLFFEIVSVSHREQVIGQIPPVVDASVHGDEALQGGLFLHVGVVEACVEHDDGKGQDVACVQGYGKRMQTNKQVRDSNNILSTQIIQQVYI